MSIHRREDVLVTLTRVMGPLIGEAMVRASVSGHWEKLKLGPHVDDQGLDRLLAAIGPGLNVFVGRRKGEALVVEVTAALRASAGGAA